MERASQSRRGDLSSSVSWREGGGSWRRGRVRNLERNEVHGDVCRCVDLLV